MSKIRSRSLIQIQQAHAAVKAAASMKRAATDEARDIARLKAVEREVVGRTVKLARGRRKKGAAPGTEFQAPAKRKKVYLSSAGLRAFHFGWSSVSKSSIDRGAPGTRVYANAAALHVVYIEDGAIARMGHTVYIDSSRVETRPDGERLVLSNISDIYQERVDFFKFVDQFERVNHGDKVEIDFEANAFMWQAVIHDPDCDPAVRAAYDDWASNTERPEKQPIVLTGSGCDLRMLMKKHGCKFADPVVNEERLKRDGFCFHDGRGGRTEYRLVFELPREFDHEQRSESLERLCLHFEEAGCMYVAVIHAPDPHNDQANYHVHLDFYDRKCRRFDDTAADLTHVKKQFKSAVEDEMALGKYREQRRARAWDFTVRRDYPSNKCTKTHYPFGDPHKSKAVRDIRFVEKVRKAFAADINAVAREAGHGDLYDPRSYAAMGMNSPASKKLGPAAHGLETRGVPTKVGLDNEAAQAKFEMHLIERAYQDRGRQIDAIELKWQHGSHESPVELETQKEAVDEELAAARLALNMHRDLALLNLERERERSRASLVSERQGRASRAGTAAAQLRSATLAKSANEYLACLDQVDSGLGSDIATLDGFTAAHGPEQVAKAISKFEQAVLRLVIRRDLSALHADQVAPGGPRNIMTKRYASVVAGSSVPVVINTPGSIDYTAAKTKVIVETDQTGALASPNIDAPNETTVSATPVTASDEPPTLERIELEDFKQTTEAQDEPQLRDKITRSSKSPAEAPLASSEDGVMEPPNGDAMQSTDEQRAEPKLMGAELEAPDLAGRILGIDGVQAPDQDSTSSELSEVLVTAGDDGVSFLVENDGLAASVDGDIGSIAEEEHQRIDRFSHNFDAGGARAEVGETGAVSVHVAETAGSPDITLNDRPGTPQPLTDEEIHDLLKPRRVGPDGVFRIADLPVDRPKIKPATVPHKHELDPVTVAKVLRTYDDFSDGAKARLPEDEKQLYLSAKINPLAEQLREALRKGRLNQQATVRDAKLARSHRQVEAVSPAPNLKASAYDQRAHAARLAQNSNGRD